MVLGLLSGCKNSAEPEPPPRDACEMGQEAIEAQDFERARRCFTRAIRENPNDPHGYTGRADANRLLGEVDEAIADCNKAIELDQKFGPAYFYRGLAYFTKHDHDRAVDDYTRAAERMPKQATIYYNRAMVYLARKKEGDGDRALADFGKAIEVDPKYADAYANRGIHYHNRREYEKAIAEFNKVIELTPEEKRGYLLRANAYRMQGEHKKAIEDEVKAAGLRR
jgi:tetratricopeptide (TPR) repeat protein